MADTALVLAIDQGTTSTRVILFDQALSIRKTAQQEFHQHFPESGWVEHDPEEIWSTTVAMCRQAVDSAGASAAQIAAIGITNQRETTVVWDKTTGRAVYNAIVWQDRRTAAYCESLRAAGYETDVTARTGLLLDPYFSATKLRWILENVEGARAQAEAGNLLFGTIDTYLIWRMTGGKRHVTDATNAARTMLYNITKGDWDDDMLTLLDIPRGMLPEVLDCAAVFGETEPGLLGARAIPILGVAGDQQAATIGQACFAPGMLKSTYGTGCFALLNTGTAPVFSTNRLLTTIAYQLDDTPTYALEGSIFIAGAVVQWLRDGLGVITSAAETRALAAKADPHQDVIIVPAFTGLGAPYWNAECRGAVYGLTRNSGPAELSRAALESVGFQTRDLLEAMMADWTGPAGQNVLRVDGGMSASDPAMQFLSDIINAEVDRPQVLETTALGAAWLAGSHAGVLPGQAEFASNWSIERRFSPSMNEGARDTRYARWKRAVAATMQV
ncbi:glycerol kinase GlpK [Ruegeria sp. 2012CJ41-6]|uniref:Glycerol kinase n=1 Tax=Ruegeria spongiae TaxID=2942209 RepID=A0ABT0PYG2_9RHOB|nr:glycerol kinase GlpK [Ruegeria spongiae]MCL6282670.1 glycerol kinase GlpK [Ruegeria spongiae]